MARCSGCGSVSAAERLSKAKALLEHPVSHRSLLDVSQACGYLSKASFSRDFLARYGERPSQLLRRCRDLHLLSHLDAESLIP